MWKKVQDGFQGCALFLDGYSKPYQTSKTEVYAKLVNERLTGVNCLCKKLQLRSLAGFRISLWYPMIFPGIQKEQIFISICIKVLMLTSFGYEHWYFSIAGCKCDKNVVTFGGLLKTFSSVLNIEL